MLVGHKCPTNMLLQTQVFQLIVGFKSLQGRLKTQNLVFRRPFPAKIPSRSIQNKASRSLHTHKLRALPCHTPYLRATQTLRLRCRVCAVRTHAVFVATE